MRTSASEPAAHGALPGHSPRELERALDSPEAVRAVPPEARRRLLRELQALRRSLERHACSQAWVDDCWATGQAYPPPADTTPMAPCACPRCSGQGKLWPAHHVRRDWAGAAAGRPPAGEPQGVSYECHLESLSDGEWSQLPSSPSGLALRAIREGRVRIRRARTRLARPRRKERASAGS